MLALPSGLVHTVLLPAEVTGQPQADRRGKYVEFPAADPVIIVGITYFTVGVLLLQL